MVSNFIQNILVVCVSLFFVLASTPAISGTRADVKALQAEVEVLKQNQEKMSEELTEIRKLLEQGARAAPAAAPAGASFKPRDLEVGDSPTMGSADAVVTIFSYSDYQCPFCSRHATTVLPRMVKTYVDTGQVRFVMREYPIEAIHPRAFAASAAAVCADAQGKYWEMHDVIYANQRALSDDDLRSYGQQLELDSAAFEACLADDATHERIRNEISEAYDLGISGTPSFVAGLTGLEDPNTVHVTEYIRGAQSFERFKDVVDGLLQEASQPE